MNETKYKKINYNTQLKLLLEKKILVPGASFKSPLARSNDSLKSVGFLWTKMSWSLTARPWKMMHWKTFSFPFGMVHSLKLTARPWNMGAWKTFAFPFGFPLIFRCKNASFRGQIHRSKVFDLSKVGSVSNVKRSRGKFPSKFLKPCWNSYKLTAHHSGVGESLFFL